MRVTLLAFLLMLTGCLEAPAGAPPASDSSQGAPSPQPVAPPGAPPVSDGNPSGERFLCGEVFSQQTPHHPSEVLDALDNDVPVKYPPDGGVNETLRCIARAIAPFVATWNGTSYDDLLGRASGVGEPPGADSSIRWNVWLEGNLTGAGTDRYGFEILSEPDRLLLLTHDTVRMAVPPERVEAARAVFEPTADGREVLERAPHMTQARWAPGGVVLLHYDAYAEGQGGIPEHPFANVRVQPDEGRVLGVERSPWWDDPFDSSG